MGIIICDSGISDYQEINVKAVDIGCGVYDENGHGTKLVNTALLIHKTVEITSIKILDKNNQTSIPNLINALKQCKNLPDKVICLSLSLNKNVHVEELYQLMHELYSDDKIIVISDHNKNTGSILASYNFVVGVGILNNNEFEYEFDNDREIQCRLLPKAIVMKGIDEEFSIISGNSFSCIVISTLMYLSLNESKEDINNIEKILSTIDLIPYFNVKSHEENNEKFKTCKFDVQAILHKRGIKFDYKGDIDISNIELLDLQFLLDDITAHGYSINKKCFLNTSMLSNIDKFCNYLLNEM